MKDLANKTALVTGGASGIGLATAAQLAARGCNLVIVDRDDVAMQSATERLRRAGSPRVASHQCDVSDHVAMQQMAERVFDEFGNVHIVFNNAGVAVGGPVSEMSHDDWRWIIDVDLWGPIHGVEAFLKPMIAAGEGGHILFTASFAGLVPNVGLGPYCVAKYGVVALAEVLQKELREYDIGVSVLCPMRVATNIGTSERNRDADYGQSTPTSRVADQESDNRDLAGQVLDVDDVARQVVAAIDDNALYIVPHEESREFVRRRFNRIDRAFEL